MALAQRQSAQHDHDIEYSNYELDSNPQPAHNATSLLAPPNAATPTSKNRLLLNEQAHNKTTDGHADFASRRRARSRHNPERHAEQADDEALPRSYREWEELARDEKQSARLASRRAHRSFRMTWIASVAGAILFAQLLGVLYLKTSAVSASHRADDLERAIANERVAKSKTERKLSLVSSDPRMATWATTAGYRMSTQDDMDDVMNPKPLPQTPDIEYSKREETR